MDFSFDVVSDPAVQRTLSWLGGGLTTVAVALWAVFKYFKGSGAAASGGRTARAKVGVAASGNITVGRDLRVSNGVPPWIFVVGILGLVLIILRLLFGLGTTDRESLVDAIRGGFIRLETADGTPALIELGAGNMAWTHSLRPDGSSLGNGTWEIRSDRELCLLLPFALKDTGPEFCLTPGFRRGKIAMTALNSGSIAWIDKRMRSGITAGDLEGDWNAFGYPCPVGTYHVESVRVDATSEDTLSAVKIVGDPCVPAGEVTWRGKLNGSSIDVQGRVGSPHNPASDWAPGSVSIISRDLMLWDTGSGDEVAFIRRR